MFVRRLSSLHLHQSPLSRRSIASVAWNDQGITLERKDTRTTRLLPHTWLRDHCLCPRCIHPGTRQKLHGSGDIPGEIQPSSVNLTDQGLKVRWAKNSTTEKEHVSTYPREWLKDQLDPSEAPKKAFRPTPWKATDLDPSSLQIPYKDFMHSDSALRIALSLLTERGVCFLDGIPGEERAIEGIAERIGPIRDTFYGKTWDVRADPKAANIAYTSLDLGLHMDLMYFEAPPGVQILHCLEQDVYGGESLFADSHYAVGLLKKDDPEAYQALVEMPVPFGYRNDGHDLSFTRPTLVEDGPAGLEVFYSPPFQHVLPLPSSPVASRQLDAFYRGMRRFKGYIEDPNAHIRIPLVPGQCALFDNRRALHGRTAFSSQAPGKPDRTGHRWLKGTYVDRDALWDRLAVLLADHAANDRGKGL
ncbi:hypothetical protein BJ684DRAFT_11528 [Piptocephalis cylindrospora]|uniref:Gamma-butyrobetaine dioxygenase n=1 Tax=Piptocephalis cylindrospora TaxID=1907219 RepID=A0A4V1IXV7_9FUNG|nr:hypothetical protein BJ684DRAFT_11528 [Piptocephalis cylindrospora]|eukprot:RKP12399.1 hypothetical protein BJ684DRAFT_11528 [Piptocephalis cylindrospora]